MLRFPKVPAAEKTPSREPRADEERFLALADHLMAEIFCTEPPREKRPAPSRVGRATKSA